MPLEDPLPTADRLARFEAKLIPEPTTGCYLWLAAHDACGYGHFWNGKRVEKAHRFAYRVANGEIKTGEDVCHRCDTPACVNSDHLFAGPAKLNIEDMWAKGRASVQAVRGSAHPSSKLSERDAAKIKKLYSAKVFNQNELAFLYGVGQATISCVVNGKRWAKPSGVFSEKRSGR